MQIDLHFKITNFYCSALSDNTDFTAFASRSQEAGFVVLLYDDRNWEYSDRSPGQESNPALQQIDCYDAFNFVTTQPRVDVERIVY